MKKLKKVLALVLACLVLVGASVAGTLAWLTAKTENVVNTFTVGDINLDLLEHELKADGTLDTNKEVKKNEGYKFVPGDTLPKDPWVKVEANSEACYLFVHIVETNNTRTDLTEKIIDYDVDDDIWKPVANKAGYWYCTIDAATAKNGTKVSILAPKNTSAEWSKQDNVTVNENVTKDMVKQINDNNPTLTFTAAAVQMDNLPDAATGQTAIEVAWDRLPKDFTAPAATTTP